MKTFPLWIILLAGTKLAAQTPNTEYLSLMPSVTLVSRELHGADPRETAFLQIGAFNQLQEIVYGMAHYQRRGRDRLTPAEQRVVQSYYEAAFYAGQAVEKTLTTEDEKRKFRLESAKYSYDRTNRNFGVQGVALFKLFFPAGFEAQFRQAVAQGDARSKAFSDANSLPPPEPKTVGEAVTGMAAAGQSIARSMASALGVNLDSLNAVPQGLRMSGTYSRPGGLTLSFRLDAASISCGTATNDHAPYAVALKDGQVLVTFQASPGAGTAFSFVLRPDGALAQSGTVSMTSGSDGAKYSCTAGILSPASR